MIIYIYDKDNFSFIASKEAQPNPLSIGEYLMPENSTTIAPPNTLDGHIACFIDGEWVIKTDHRGHYQVKLDDVTFSIVDYIGDAQAGYQFISDEVYADYQEDNDKYKVVDGVFTDISDTEEYREIKEAKERERVGNLTCTKRVLVLMLQEYDINYFEQIKPLIESNPQAQIEWDLCVQLERKNPLLDTMGEELGITSLQLDMLFKAANGENSMEEFLAARGE